MCDRAIAGIRLAKAQGQRLGRPYHHHMDLSEVGHLREQGLALRGIARRLGAYPTAVSRALATA